MFKEGLVLNNPQGLICHKIKPNQTVYTWSNKKIFAILNFVRVLCLFQDLSTMNQTRISWALSMRKTIS